MDIDLVRFITMNFNQIRDCYHYAGSKQLYITDEDKDSILYSKTTSYQKLSIDDRKKHFERIHSRFVAQSSYPSITVYDKNSNSKLIYQPISHYDHTRYTSEIKYAFNEYFMALHDQFIDGYRDVCVNVLDHLQSRYARLFFVYLSGSMNEFQFSEEKLREILNLNTHHKKRKTGEYGPKYVKRTAINTLLKRVREEFKTIDIDFDYAYCTKKEWEKYTLNKDNPQGAAPPSVSGLQNSRKNRHPRNFHIRAMGMEKYRIPKGMQSAISVDIAANEQYDKAYKYLSINLKIPNRYIDGSWEYIKRYIGEWGAQKLMDFMWAKKQELKTQKKKQNDLHAVLMSLIVKQVKAIDREGQGIPTLFSVPEAPDGGRVDLRGKSYDEVLQVVMEDQARRHPPNTS